MHTSAAVEMSWVNSPLDQEGAFAREDESEDKEFYDRPRMVDHLDAVALDTVARIIGSLVIEPSPVILDLMASRDSHLPPTLEPARVVGLGLNELELLGNPALSERVVHDLNRQPDLPFADGTFDVVLNTVSVDYLTQPLAVFREVARVLKPGGLHLVIFSNRMFPEKAVRVWRDSSEEERVLLVEEMFARAGGFGPSRGFVSRNKPRPAGDKYAEQGIPSDPVYAVYADKGAASGAGMERPALDLGLVSRPDDRTLAARKAAMGDTLRCPYCEQKMNKWAVPDNPFAQTWDNEFMYICFNDLCPYYLEGWDTLASQGVRCTSYRLMYDPLRGVCQPVPVPTHLALRDGIVE